MSEEDVSVSVNDEELKNASTKSAPSGNRIAPKLNERIVSSLSRRSVAAHPLHDLDIDIKGFLADVKPALLSALEAEYEKNLFEDAAVALEKIVKASDSMSSVSAAGFDGLPREDISANITHNLLKNMGSLDLKVRLESIESINKILEEANKHIQAAGTDMQTPICRK